MNLPELPEDIKRIILLSLPPKEFACTSVLSKSWRSFYNSIRRSFNFSLQHYPYMDHEEVRQEIVNFDNSLSASLLREKLVVDEFNVYVDRYDSSHMESPICKWLAALLTANNEVKVLRIRIPKYLILCFPLPTEIFHIESLQVLHVEGCSLNPKLYRFRRTVNLASLRVLSLFSVRTGYKLMRLLLAACPFLEQFTLVKCFPLRCVRIKGLHKLKELDIRRSGPVKIKDAPALEKITLLGSSIYPRSTINSRVRRRIKNLEMDLFSTRRQTHFEQVVSELPALENLNLTVQSSPCGSIRISSRSLKNFRLHTHYLHMVRIKAPNLRCYEYEGACFSPHLMRNSAMLEKVAIHLEIGISGLYPKSYLINALRMIEELKLGVDSIKLVDSPGKISITARSLDKGLKVSASGIIDILRRSPLPTLTTSFYQMIGESKSFSLLAIV